MPASRVVLALIGGLLAGPLLAQNPPPLPPPPSPDRLQELERRRDQLLNARRQDLLQLDQQLNALSADVGPRATIADLAAALRRDSARVSLLETMNRRQLEARFDLQALRYQTGLEVLGIVLRNTEKLDFTTSLATTLAAFDQAANPLNSPTFRAEIEALSTSGSDGARLSLPEAMLQNPLVSTAHFLASLFTSRANRRSKEETLARLSCVLDFTTRANRDARDLSHQLEGIDLRTKALLRDGELAFARYTGVVGPATEWSAYKREQAGSAREGVPTRIDGYFNTRKQAAMVHPWAVMAVDDLVESNYQLDQVKLLLTRHEAMLEEMENFLERFEGAVRRYETARCDAIPGLAATTRALIQQAAENRARFRAGWFGDVPARSRAILYTSP